MDLLLRTHRTYVPVAESPQKLFVSLRLKPGEQTLQQPRITPSVSIVVDTSGSMYTRGDDGVSKMDTAISVIGAIPSVPGFSIGAEVSLIQFDASASVLLPQSQLADNAEAVMKSHAERLRAFNGGTMLSTGLRLALEELSKSTEGTARSVILLTDGETGDAERCFALADQAVHEGIDFFCVGIGEDYNEDFLTELAERTRGGLAHVGAGADGASALFRALSGRLTHAQRETLSGGTLAVSSAPFARLVDVSQVYPKCLRLPASAHGVWHIGAMAEDDDPVILLEFEIDNGPPGELKVATVEVRFTDASGERHSLSKEVVIGRTEQLDAVRSLDASVMHYVRQRNVAALVDDAARRSRQGEFDAAHAAVARARRITNMLGHVVLDRKLARADQQLTDGEAISVVLRKDLKVTSRMGTNAFHHGDE